MARLELNIKNNNQSVMSAIKKMHSFVENTDIKKQRHTQDTFGMLFGANKELEFEPIKIGHMKAEWTRLRHSHRKQPTVLSWWRLCNRQHKVCT